MAFVGASAGVVDTGRKALVQKRGRRRVIVAQININKDEGLEARKEEIADKIRKLRKAKAPQREQKEVEEPPPAQISAEEETSKAEDKEEILQGVTAEEEETASVMTEEEMLLKEMEEAEKFMTGGLNVGKGSGTSGGTSGDTSKYQPKVSTWGVFERPDNISKAYGGGKRIPVGGVNLDDEKEKEKAAQTKKLLSEFKVSTGIENAEEEKYREEIEAAIAESDKLLLRARPQEARKLLETYTDKVGLRSELGGSLHLQLAVVYETIGLREMALELYTSLRKSPVQEISSRAKRLSFGFYAMDELNMDADSEFQMDWKVPDFDVKRRYDVSYIGDKKRKEIGLNEVEQTSDSSNTIVAVSFLALLIGGLLSVSLSSAFR